MHQMIELHPQADALNGLGLPAIPYPVALSTFQAAVANDGELPLADMLHGLQLRAAVAGAKWQPLAPAMVRLAELLARDADAALPSASTASGWPDIGPVDLEGPTVALHRDGVLLAAATPGADGRLRVAAYQPLDARTADLLLASGPEHGGSPSAEADAWQRLLAMAQAGSPPDADGGFTAEWLPDGLAMSPDSPTAEPRDPAHVAAELGVRHALAGARA